MYKFLILLLIFFCAFTVENISNAKIEPDTDKDGLSDYEELHVYKSNYDKADTDGDGYLDGDEVYNGYSPNKINEELNNVNLAVPYINEAPDDDWTGPWKNACEESSIAMVENYYLGRKAVNKWNAKNYMISLFNFQDTIYGSNADADSIRTLKIIQDKTSFNGKIVKKPTLEQIKKELQQKRPVISLHYGFGLKNKNIPFLATGSSYHMMVIVGYDDDKKEFITNDPGDRVAGHNHRYSYDLFMNTLHDFDFKTKRASGEAVVIFTSPKLVKTVKSGKVYLVDKDKKYHVTSMDVFKEKGWNWDMVVVVEKEWLDNFEKGDSLVVGKSDKVNNLKSKATGSRYIFSSYLRLGSSGEEVKQLQIKLKSLGHFTYPQITGYFGPVTKAAVIRFQKAKSLWPYPGWVGPETRGKLNEN